MLLNIKSVAFFELGMKTDFRGIMKEAVLCRDGKYGQ